MNCNAIDNLLSAFLDEELPASQRRLVAEHLDHCVRCSQELNDLRRQDALLAGTLGRRLPVPDLPVALPARSSARTARRGFGGLLGKARLALAGAGVLAASVFGWVATRPPVLHVERVVGTPTLVSSEGPRDLRSGVRLAAGDVLTTEANEKVEVQWPDGSKAVLSPEGEARLLADGRGLRLARGRVWAHVAKGHPGFRVEGPSATAEVLGTQFVVTADATGATLLAVWEGRVKFHNDRGAVVATAWEQTAARRSMAPAPPTGFSPLGPGSLWWMD